MTSRRRPSRRRPFRLASLLIASLLTAAIAVVLLVPGAAVAGQYVDAAAGGLKDSPVYVSAAADPKPTAAQQEELRQRISGADVPIYIAVLPEAALDEGGGSAKGVNQQIYKALGRPGVYAVLVGSDFRGDSTMLPSGVAPRLATEAFQANRGNGPQAVLLDFVDRVKAAAAQGGGAAPSQTPRSGSGAGAVLGIVFAVLVVVGGGALFLSSRRRRREREQQLAQVKSVAQEDLLALSDDIRALDIDTQMPGASPDAVSHYSAAVDWYQKATDRLDRARRIEDMAAVSSALEEGRFAMASAKALLDGRPLPERRPPCFFDPRHGPSTEDVTWSPPGGVPREVPACATCAHQVRSGIEPQSRQVLVNDRPVPFYQAPAWYGPWYGGYFGGGAGGFLTGLLIGDMLGGFGGWGVPVGAGMGGGYDGGDAGDGGDWGGGGDFGGGGGDFGGGGGGDFGGGGGDF